jgi:hypothetical protein
MTVGQFFYYHAKHLAIDKARPWQVSTWIGCLLAKLATEEQAKAAVEALTADQAAGVLPCNLALWDKRHLLN